MSLIQVLIGFGLASILGLVLAEMNSNSNKQMGNVRLQFERAAIVQSLQSIISNPEVCQDMIDTQIAFGPVVTDSVSGTSLPSIRVRFFLDGNGSGGATGQRTIVVQEGQPIPNYSLKVDWIRAFNPQPVTIPRPGTEKVYMANLKIKLSPTAAVGSEQKKFIDMRSQDVGRVYFVTTDLLSANPRVVTCYGDAAGLTLCPSNNDVQVMSGGSWSCSPLSKAIGSLCPGGGTQVVQSSGGDASCAPLYKVTQPGCEGFGGFSSSASCNTGVCIASAGSTQQIPLPSFSIPYFSGYDGYVGFGGYGGGSVTSGGSAPVGSMPGSSGSTTTIPSIPAIAHIPSIPSFGGGTIGGGTTSVTIPVIRYKSCSGSCDQASSVSCGNTQ